MYSFSDEGVFIGFVGSWKIGDYFYIEHLAISPNLRGKGYGQKVLSGFCEQVSRVILEIDPVIDEISEKRLRFTTIAALSKMNINMPIQAIILNMHHINWKF